MMNSYEFFLGLLLLPAIYGFLYCIWKLVDKPR